MKTTYIGIQYMKLIIKHPHSAGVVGSPVRMCGGWLVAPPNRKASTHQPQ